MGDVGPGARHRAGEVRAFLAGPENHLAITAVLGLLGSEVERQPWRRELFQPLVLYGPSGSGKSHLAHGLAEQWGRLHPQDRVVTIAASDFASELADAIEANRVSAWRKRFRQTQLLVVENLSAITRKLPAQSELLHLIDALLDEHQSVVLTLNEPPSRASGLLPNLVARLVGGLVVPLELPGAAARRALLEQLAAARQLSVDADVLLLLADQFPRSAPELHGALSYLAAEARASHQPITREMVLQYVARQTASRSTTLRNIATRTARHFGVTVADLKSPVRRRGVVLARDVAMYLARVHTDHSLQQIGHYFGGRDHTTVLHGCRKIEERLATDTLTRDAVAELAAIIDNQGPKRRSLR